MPMLKSILYANALLFRYRRTNNPCWYRCYHVFCEALRMNGYRVCTTKSGYVYSIKEPK